MKRKKGFYSISVVAKMFSVHQQTVRLYEKEGLITPKRTDGNTRLFSEEDVERLEEIIHLTHTLGVNLAGVEMIFKLQKKIKKLQDDMNKLFTQTQTQMNSEVEVLKVNAKKQKDRLVELKQESVLLQSNLKRSQQTIFEAKDESEENVDTWKIDYDE
jgi:MerR family transcriptional regulator/heat shock protein HspR